MFTMKCLKKGYMYLCGIESVLKKIVVIVIKNLLGSRLCDLSIFWPLAPTRPTLEKHADPPMAV